MATQEELMLQKRKLELELELAEAEESEAVSPEEIAFEPEPAPQMSIPAAMLKGAQEGVTLGTAPYIAGVAGGLGALSAGGDFSSAYEEAKNLQKAEQQAAQAAHPVAYTGSAIAGGVALPGSSLPALVAQGAVAGGATTEGDLWEKAKGAVLGGTIGGVAKVGGDKISKSAGEALDALRPVYDKIKSSIGLDAAQRWLSTQAGKFAEQAAGLERTQGQREALAAMLKKGKIEEGEIGQKLLEEGIVTPLASSSTIAARSTEAKKAAGEEIGRILKETPDVSVYDLEQAIRAKANTFENKGSDLAKKQEMLRIADTYKTSPELEDILIESLPATKVAQFKSEAGKLADWQAPQTDVQAQLNRTLDEQLKAAMPEETKSAFEAANRSYELLTPAERAAGKQSAADMGKKLISVGTMPAMGLGYGYSEGGVPGAVAGALAFRTAQKRGPQIMAGGLQSAAKFIEKAPDRLKGVLQSAAERGEKSFAATHYLLQQKDPEYNKATTDEEE